MTPEAAEGRGVVAVTGASGYIGSRLVAMLGTRARALVRSPVGAPTTDHRVVDLLADPDEIAADLDGVDAVVHLAGHNEVVAAADPDRALSETVVAARHLVAAAAAADVRRMVYVSTVHVYGARAEEGARLDEDIVPEPATVYSIARLASEHVIRAAASDSVVLRLTNAVGAPASPAVDRWTLVATDLCRQAVRDGKLVLRSSGRQWRDFVDLGDVCSAIAECTRPRPVEPGTYNLGAGIPHTVLDLATLVQDRMEVQTGQRPPLEAPPHDGPHPAPHHVDTGRLASAGITCDRPLSESVDELVAFCLEHQEALRA